MNKKNFWVIAFFCGIALPFFCHGTAYRLTTAEIDVLNTNQTAIEDRNYFDTNLEIYKKGLPDGTISAEINRDPVRQNTSVLQSIDIGKTATELLFYWDTLLPRYFFGDTDKSLEPLIVQNLFSASSEITNTEVLDNSGLRNQSQNGEIQPGRGYLFDGSNDYVVLPSNLITGNQQGSVSLRINPTETGLHQLLFTYGGQDTSEYITLYRNPTNKLQMMRNDDTLLNEFVLSTQTIPAGVWTFITITWDDISMKAYIDGDFVGELIGDFDPDIVQTTWLGNTDNRTYYYKGEMNDVHIFNRALSADEISGFYQKNLIVPSGGIAHYKMDEGAGTIAYDSTGNGNHGTITNATLSTFHTTDPEGSDWQNQVGYTEDETGSLTGTAGVLIPRNETLPTQDVLGNSLEYRHRVNYNAKLVESHCGNFDGVDDYVALPNNLLDAYNEGTIFAHINANNISQSGLILGVGTGTDDPDNNFFQFGIGPSVLSLAIRHNASNQIIATVPMTLAQKDVSIAARMDATTGLSLWVNGESLPITYVTGSTANRDWWDDIASTTDLYSLGALIRIKTGWPSTSFFSGTLADVQLFNRAISDSEMNSLFAGETVSSGLVAHYPLAEGAGLTTYDASGNGNPGTVTNTTEVNFWSQTQDAYHYNLKNGFSRPLQKELGITTTSTSPTQSLLYVRMDKKQVTTTSQRVVSI
jgi:hypothetical protein